MLRLCIRPFLPTVPALLRRVSWGHLCLTCADDWSCICQSRSGSHSTPVFLALYSLRHVLPILWLLQSHQPPSANIFPPNLAISLSCAAVVVRFLSTLSSSTFYVVYKYFSPGFARDPTAIWSGAIPSPLHSLLNMSYRRQETYPRRAVLIRS